MGTPGRARLGQHGTAAVAAALAAALVLGGCSGTRDALGLSRTAPDEFAVVSKAPLILPPDFALRPPMPGAPGPLQIDPAQNAQAALLNQPAAGAAAAAGSAAPAGAASPGEVALLQAAGAPRADPGVRALIELEAARIADRGKGFAERVLFWQQVSPRRLDAVIDPVAEAERLRAEGAVGLPPNVGLPEARRAGGLLPF